MKHLSQVLKKCMSFKKLRKWDTFKVKKKNYNQDLIIQTDKVLRNHKTKGEINKLI